MAGLRITIIGRPAGDQQLIYTLSAEPADLEPEEIALVLRTIAEQLDTGRIVERSRTIRGRGSRAFE